MPPDDVEPPRPPEQPEPDAKASPTPTRILSSEELLQGAREVWIEHGRDMYRLRVTASGKLYLTK